MLEQYNEFILKNWADLCELMINVTYFKLERSIKQENLGRQMQNSKKRKKDANIKIELNQIKT